MQQKIQVCIQCSFSRPVNSKGICPQCTFENNHRGLSQREVYLERHKLRENHSPVTNYSVKPKSEKRLKNDHLKKNEKLEKVRKRIEADEVYYEKIFNQNPCRCEECGCPLPEEFRDEEGKIIFRTQYSHILSKGAFNEYRHCLWNMNRLCAGDHHKWEFGDKKSMKIYLKNKQSIIENTGRDILE